MADHSCNHTKPAGPISPSASQSDSEKWREHDESARMSDESPIQQQQQQQPVHAGEILYHSRTRLMTTILFSAVLLVCLGVHTLFNVDDATTTSRNILSLRRLRSKARRMQEVRRGGEPVHLVYSSDERSIDGVKASIRSVIDHASEDVVFHFVGDQPIRSMPFVNFYNISDVVNQYNLSDFVNIHSRHGGNSRVGVNLNQNMPNYIRFVMDELLPDVKKAMWIDSDTIVKCDVVNMVHGVLTDDDTMNNNNDHVLAAVPVFSPPAGVYKEDKHGNPFPDWGIETSFNAGIYVVHLDRWREQHVSEQIRSLALKNRKYRYYQMGSQPPLVLTIGENFERLPLSWNVKMKTIDEQEDMSLEDACVLHWSGPLKPWDGNGQHLEEWLPYHVDNVEESSDEEEDER